MKQKKSKLRAVLIGTADKGLYYGFIPDDGTTNVDIHGTASLGLTRARMVVYHTGVGGAIGLAAGGPKPRCRVGPAAEDIAVGPVTGVASVTPEIVKVWEDFTWTP